MSTLDALRSVLERELELFGAFLPLPDDSLRSAHAKDGTVFAPEEDHPVDRGSSPISESDKTDLSPAAVHSNQSISTHENLFGETVDPTTDTSLSPYQRILSLIPPDSPLREMHSLEDVNAYVASTPLVPIDSSRINPVPGVGDPNADLMVIGEAPGADEDRKGEPFVGRAGELLTKILAAIAFQRSDVYITNILKSRPPNNRDPEKEEVNAHLPILLRQITLIKPKLILCVGRIAGNVLLDRKSSLKALREKAFHDFYGLPVKVTYHPAALLRNPQWKRPTWEDVQVLKARYDELVANR
jgi:DNA polymerase